ncbi:cupin domain-containing protein [Paradesertivirga mongoliensis]|uniref:Cupin domain-containing protein n=1 Tax=Paradesertivirga mongoliensis TaxID=2100740 RepID=A0ABW4ZQ98_9SPHI|nr:cupin domain-containing protein [Pedobacter mongoliensis]
MNKMSTVTEVLQKLKEGGYTVDFNLSDNCLICHGNSLQIHPEEFVVDEHYRFEGATDPGDEAIVYAISSTKHNIKGTLINGYGISSDPATDKIIAALKEKSSIEIEAPSVEKSNDATPQRSAGERTLDAEMVVLDLNTAQNQIKSEAAWHNSDRNAITLLKNEGLRIVLIALHAEAELKAHKAPGIITVQVLDGHINFKTDKLESGLRKGEMLTLQTGITHSVFAVTEAVFLLTIAIEKNVRV